MQANLRNVIRRITKEITINQTIKIISYQKIKRLKNDENTSISAISRNIKS